MDQVRLDLFKKLGITKYTIDPADNLAIVNQDVDASYQDDPDILKKLGIKKVSRNFSCSKNSLTSLEGAPSTVGGDFYCYNNSLTSLEGAPSTVGGDFDCSYNSLTSLEGAPSTVGGYFYCDNNSLTSLKGAPSTVGGDFYCSGNSVEFTVEDVKKYSKVDLEIYTK